MALFKIFKGSDTNKLLDKNRLPINEGYAYYNTKSQLFYIDAAYPVTDYPDGIICKDAGTTLTLPADESLIYFEVDIETNTIHSNNPLTKAQVQTIINNNFDYTLKFQVCKLDRKSINATYALHAYEDSFNNNIPETYIKNIQISGTDLIYTRGNNGTTTLGIPMIEYTGGLGITINDNDEIVNAGVRAIASGSENGTISVNTNGNTTNVAITGLSDLAYISKPASGSNTIFLNSNGSWNEIPAATTEQLGGVKIGSGLNVDASGALNVKLSSVINSTATDYAATSYAVKQAYDLAASKTSNVGTVTSVTLTAGTGIAISDDGTAITSSGSRTISHATTPIGTTSILGSTATNTYLTGIIVDNLGHVDSVTTATVTITDTKNTAGSTDSSEKLFLIGAESQATSATTYSNSKVFIQNNSLYSNNKIVLTEHQDIPVTSVAGMAGGAVTLKTLNLFGKVDYNGSTDEVVKVSDLGLSKAMTFLGITTTQLTEGNTNPTVTLKGSNTAVTATEGDVVIIDEAGDEYVWSQGVWQSLGYATNYALENHIHGNINSSGAVSTTATIADGNHLLITGSDNKIVASNITFGTATTTYLRNDGTWATLSTYSAGTGITLTDTTFSHTIPTNATAGTLGSSTARYYIKTITTDKFGHVTGVTTGNETVENSDTKNTAGSINSTSKLYLVGTTSQTASAVTYSHSAVYATGGQLDANKVRIGEHVTLQYNTTTNALDFVFT